LPPRGHATGRRPAGVLGALVAAALLGSACSPPAEGSAGLLVTADGALQRLDGAGALHPISGLPPNVRHVASAGGTTVVATDDERYFVASPAGPSLDDVTWRVLAVEPPATGFTTGIDVSPAGTSLAIVRAHDDANVLDLLIVKLADGAGRQREVAMAANGPPSWLTNAALAMEVSGPDDHTTQARVALPDGDPLLSASRGFALAASADGRRIAVADDATEGIGIAEPSAWWAGKAAEPAVPQLVDRAVQDVAIDADGTRIAVVYAHGDSPSWTVGVHRLVGDRWQPVTSFEVESPTPPTIDWLE
jgi:hypothetical protein